MNLAPADHDGSGVPPLIGRNRAFFATLFPCSTTLPPRFRVSSCPPHLMPLLATHLFRCSTSVLHWLVNSWRAWNSIRSQEPRRPGRLTSFDLSRGSSPA